MAATLKNRSLLTLLDFTPEEIRQLLDLAHEVKKNGPQGKAFKGKNLAMLFEKRSTRTRCAFETAFAEEGGHPVFLSSADIQLGAKESIEDTARVLGRMFSGIEFRGFSQKHVEKLAQYSGVPVFNGLTDDYHPTQALADVMTLEEAFGKSTGLTWSYVGDGRNNVATSLIIISAKLGINIKIISPKELFPEEALIEKCKALPSAADIIVSDALDAVEDSDAVYTDVWVSMGEEDKSAERLTLLKPYQVNENLMAKTTKDASIFLHCLPAVKDNEVSYDVIEGKQSRVWDQAENRKHTIKAVMMAMID